MEGFPGGAVVKPPAKQEMQVRSLGREDPLEEDMAAHSSTLAWRIPWAEEPGGLQSTGSQRVRRDLGTKQHKQWVPHISGIKQYLSIPTVCWHAFLGLTSYMERPLIWRS